MIRKGVFASNATSTEKDRDLEAAINEKLKKLERGSVSLYTIDSDEYERYGMVFSFGTKTKTFTRNRFELDIDEIVSGLGITAQGMMNAGLPRGWVDDPDDADFVDVESYTDSIYGIG